MGNSNVDESPGEAATTNTSDEPATRRPWRLWPGVVAAVLGLLAWFVLPIFSPDLTLYGLMGGVICALIIHLWWLFLSRALWLERLGVFLLMVIAMVATSRIVDKSIANAGMCNSRGIQQRGSARAVAPLNMLRQL